MQAIILAGGKGTRLKPYTTNFPKSLVPVGDAPILETIIKQLKNNGFNKITLAVGHMAGLIQVYFEDGKKWGVEITYSLERKPLGTAGPIKLINNLEDNFLVLNSDDLTDINYKDFFNQHINNKSTITISRFIKSVKIDFGVVETDESKRVKEYVEKPEYTFGVSMGIYAFKKEAIEYIPEDSYFDFPQLIQLLIKKGLPVHTIDHKGFWLDIGRPEDYEHATAIYDEIKTKIF